MTFAELWHGDLREFLILEAESDACQAEDALQNLIALSALFGGEGSEKIVELLMNRAGMKTIDQKAIERFYKKYGSG